MSTSEIDKDNIITVMMEELTEEERKAYLLVEEHVKTQFLKGFKKDRGGLIKRVEEFILPSLKLNKDNIITATMEELTEEERKAYLLVEEHVKAQFLKGFKKYRGGLVKRVEEFVLPSLKLSKDKVEEISNVSLSPSDMFHRMSSMMDQKIVAAQAATGDILIKLSSDVDALKGKQHMSNPNSSDPSSATPEFTSEPLYGMPPNSFPGQTPPPSTVHTAPARPVP